MTSRDALLGRIIDAANPDDGDDIAIRIFLAGNLGTVLTMCRQAKESAEISVDPTIAHDELRGRIIDAANPDDSDDIAIRIFLAANLGTVLTMCQHAIERAEISVAPTIAHDVPRCNGLLHCPESSKIKMSCSALTSATSTSAMSHPILLQ
jgi:hypothetical protein